MNIQYPMIRVPEGLKGPFVTHVLSNAMSDYLRSLPIAMDAIRKIMEAVIDEQPVRDLQWVVTEAILFAMFDAQVGLEEEELLLEKVITPEYDMFEDMMTILEEHGELIVEAHKRAGFEDDHFDFIYKQAERRHGDGTT